jgi:hypothetical protein
MIRIHHSSQIRRTGEFDHNPRPQARYQVLSGRGEIHQDPVPSSPVFGADVDVQTVQRLKNQWFADRFWAQGNVTLTAEAQCGLDDQGPVSGCPTRLQVRSPGFSWGTPSPGQFSDLNSLNGVLALDHLGRVCPLRTIKPCTLDLLVLGSQKVVLCLDRLYCDEKAANAE